MAFPFSLEGSLLRMHSGGQPEAVPLHGVTGWGNELPSPQAQTVWTVYRPGSHGQLSHPRDRASHGGRRRLVPRELLASLHS